MAAIDIGKLVKISVFFFEYPISRKRFLSRKTPNFASERWQNLIDFNSLSRLRQKNLIWQLTPILMVDGSERSRRTENFSNRNSQILEHSFRFTVDGCKESNVHTHTDTHTYSYNNNDNKEQNKNTEECYLSDRLLRLIVFHKNLIRFRCVFSCVPFVEWIRGICLSNGRAKVEVENFCAARKQQNTITKITGRTDNR